MEVLLVKNNQGHSLKQKTTLGPRSLQQTPHKVPPQQNIKQPKGWKKPNNGAKVGGVAEDKEFTNFYHWEKLQQIYCFTKLDTKMIKGEKMSSAKPLISHPDENDVEYLYEFILCHIPRTQPVK